MTPATRRSSRVRALACAVAALLAGAGDARAEAPKLHVLATFLPMYVFTKNVIGSRANVAVDLMLPAGLGCPHDYALSPGDMKKIATADLLIANGMGMEAFLGETVHEANPKLRIIDTSAAAGIEPVRSGSPEDHGRNPHVWVSPRRAAAQVRAIGEALAQADPEGAGEYRKNAQAYASRLEDLASRIEGVVRAAPNRRVITFHDILDYLAADTGIEIAGVIEETAGQAPSPRALARLVEMARKNRPAAILTEPQYPDRLARTLEKETGVPIHPIDPFATGDTRPDAYEKAMEANLERLRGALGEVKP